MQHPPACLWIAHNALLLHPGPSHAGDKAAKHRSGSAGPSSSSQQQSDCGSAGNLLLGDEDAANAATQRLLRGGEWLGPRARPSCEAKLSAATGVQHGHVR
jgi:hypothetical protein